MAGTRIESAVGDLKLARVLQLFLRPPNGGFRQSPFGDEGLPGRPRYELASFVIVTNVKVRRKRGNEVSLGWAEPALQAAPPYPPLPGLREPQLRRLGLEGDDLG